MKKSLEQDLKDNIKGEVRFGNGDRAMYSADASNYREVPRGVVIPKGESDVVAAIAACSRHNVSIVNRGGGTGLCGQTVSEQSVVIDNSKYFNRVLEIDPQNRTAWVEPGCVLDHLMDEAKKYGLMFGPNPATHNHNTLGGMIGNNSCGPHSVEAHRTSDNVEELEILTYDGLRLTIGKTSEEELEKLEHESGRRGDIYRGLKFIRDTYADEIRARYPKIPRRVSGYNLDELLPENSFNVARALVGTEGTCVTILKAKVKLIPLPKHKVWLVIGFDDVTHAADAVPEIRPFREKGMVALEGMDNKLIENIKHKNYHVEDLKYLPEGKGWLFAEFHGDNKEESSALAEALHRKIKHNRHVTEIKLITEQSQISALAKIREAGLGVTAWVPGTVDSWEGWEDSAVAPENLGAYMRDLQALYKEYGYDAAMYGHFGDGLIHTRIPFGLHTEPQVAKFRKFIEAAASLVVRHGGTLSGEHGDGRSKAEMLPIMYGAKIMEAFEHFKRIWDPLNKMNPGKIVNPKPLDTDLRYGPKFEARKPQLETVFNFPESQNSFDRAIIRCVGVGECRKHKGGTMCPSYRATHEEKHSTRGRSRLLQEILEGDVITDKWKSKEVEEALNLCLSCKACASECPVNVDMATYRAEFYNHYYKSHHRPLASFGMGLVHRWAPLASKAPWLMNFITQTKGINAIAKAVAGVHQKRDLPPLAKKTFRKMWRADGNRNEHANKNESKIRVILWADSFNNYFTPKPLLAAAQLLEKSGYEVILPKQGLCCGRPYYDFGRLNAAKDMLAKTVESLTPLFDGNTWLVGIEPSCLSVFKEEMIKLFPNDERAKMIRGQTMTLGGFLKKHGHPEIKLESDVVIHGHCHHKSVLDINSEVEILKTSGKNVKLLDDGCCGMAGAFGYEKDKYEVSKKIAELGVVSHLNETPQETIVAADGFSCRHQIAHFTERETITLPELLLKAIK